MEVKKNSGSTWPKILSEKKNKDQNTEGIALIDAEASAKLYFDKANSTRTGIIHFWTLSISSMMVMLMPLFFNEYLRTLMDTFGNVILFGALLCGFSVVIYLGNFLLVAKYREYKSNYVMFYSAGFLVKYSSDHNIPLGNIPVDAVEKIAESVHMNTYFDMADIRKGLYTYYHKVLRMNPGWLEEEINAIKTTSDSEA
ncbi:MAG: hypothetical protein LBT41_03050 [Candidatus Methanoplasma sp.]|jgi:hypothetical protein|nr:hypothetical protein [Candidatus Methanoplasma sp.]